MPIHNPNIYPEVILRQKLVVVVPATHPLAKLRVVRLEQLAAMTWVRPSNRDAKFVEKMTEIAAREGVKFASTIEHDNVLSALHTVGLGLGFALVPDYHREILPRSIVARPLDLDPQPTMDLCMAYRKDDRTPALPFFLETARECSGIDLSRKASAPQKILTKS